jgi:hypothetical protein
MSKETPAKASESNGYASTLKAFTDPKGPGLSHPSAVMLLAYLVTRPGECPKDMLAFAFGLRQAPPVWAALLRTDMIGFARMLDNYGLPPIDPKVLQGAVAELESTLVAA